MVHSILTVAGKEFNRLRKSFLFWMGLILISIAPELINNPIVDAGVLCTAKSVAYYILYTAFITDTIAISLLIGYICFYDDKTEMDSVILTQPITTKCYAAGRFLAVLFMWIMLALIRVALIIFIPLYFKAAPYSPLPFLEATFVYLFPAMFYFIAFAYLFLMLFKSPVVTVILSMVWGFAQMSVLHNTIFDVNLQDKVQTFVYEGGMTDAFRSYYITNRLSLIAVGLILLAAAVMVYRPGKKKTSGKWLSIIGKIKVNYNFRIQPAVIRTAVVLIGILCVLTTLTATDSENWYTVKMLIIMLPIFLISNVISEEYASGRDGILFTAATPIYKQMLTRVLYGWMFSEGIIFICYLAAYAMGFETGFGRFIAMAAMSTFLAALGLTASNVSKKPLLGFIVPIAYYMFFALQGSMLNESLEAISFVNVILTSQILWTNVISMAVMSLVLVLFNVYYLGNGENIRKQLLTAGASAIAVVVVVFGVKMYFSNNSSEVSAKVLSDSNTIYILQSEDKDAEETLKKRNIDYKTMDSVNVGDFKDHNVVIVSDYGCEDKIKGLDIISSVGIDNDGIKVNDFTIDGAEGFSLTVKNPDNEDNNVTVMESKSWGANELDMLMNAEMGNFIAEKDGISMAYSNYDLKTPESIEKNLMLDRDDTWLMKKKDDVKILYRDIPDAAITVDDLLATWSVVHNEAENISGQKITDTVMLYFRDKAKDGLRDDAVQIELNDRRALDAPKLEEERFMQSMSDMVLSQTVTKNLEDEDMRIELNDYLFRKKMVPALKNLDKNILDYNYKVTDGDIEEFYKETPEDREFEMNRVRKNIYSDRANINTAAKNIFYTLGESNNSIDKIVREISSSDAAISEADLKNMFSRYYKASEIDETFGFYTEVKEACEKYGGLGLMLKPVDSESQN